MSGTVGKIEAIQFGGKAYLPTARVLAQTVAEVLKVKSEWVRHVISTRKVRGGSLDETRFGRPTSRGRWYVLASELPRLSDLAIIAQEQRSIMAAKTTTRHVGRPSYDERLTAIEESIDKILDHMTKANQDNK